jgi:hypothetical protein
MFYRVVSRVEQVRSGLTLIHLIDCLGYGARLYSQPSQTQKSLPERVANIQHIDITRITITGPYSRIHRLLLTVELNQR